MRGFLDVVEGLSRDGDVWRGQAGDGWLQGRTCYGGLVAACGARALEAVAADAGGGPAPLISLDVAFIAPIPPGELEVRAQVLRAGRYATQASAEVWAQGACAARLYGVLGTRRESALAVEGPRPRPSKALADAQALPFIEGVTPQFTRHFAYHWTEGGFPFTGGQEAVLGGYVRHKTRADLSAASILGLLDAWPAPILPLAASPIPASTVRWACHFLQDPPAGFDGAWWYRAETVAARGGYATATATLYAGEVCVAWSEQLVAAFG